MADLRKANEVRAKENAGFRWYTGVNRQTESQETPLRHALVLGTKCMDFHMKIKVVGGQ